MQITSRVLLIPRGRQELPARAAGRGCSTLMLEVPKICTASNQDAFSFCTQGKALALRKESGDKDDVAGMRSTYFRVNMKALLI